MKIAAALTLAGTTAALSIAPATRSRQSIPRDVEIRSFDGQPLAATYFNPGRAGPVVVVFRNCDQKRADIADLAARVSALGAHVITWEYRGGLATNLTWAETRARDADAILAWQVSQPGVDGERVLGIGGSCGVSLALDFAERNAARVRGLVLLSGPGTASQRAFVSRTPSLALFGAASKAEGAAVFYIDSIVRASTNPANRQAVPD